MHRSKPGSLAYDVGFVATVSCVSDATRYADCRCVQVRLFKPLFLLVSEKLLLQFTIRARIVSCLTVTALVCTAGIGGYTRGLRLQLTVDAITQHAFKRQESDTSGATVVQQLYCIINTV